MLRRIAGPQAAMAAVVFGEVLDGAEAERVGLVHRCVARRRAARRSPTRSPPGARSGAARAGDPSPRQTIRDMADVDEHHAAVARELEPQLWSTKQPWFAERIAALRAKISSAAERP